MIKGEANLSKSNWFATALGFLGMGSLGLVGGYLILNDPTTLDRLGGWLILLLPYGAWQFTGFLLAGGTVSLAGFRGHDDWSARADRAWNWWVKLGLWLLGIIIVLFVATIAFGGLSDFLSSLDRGTLVIAGLLLLILLALWRIGSQMKRA